jgi:hypothetical protein
VEQIPRDSDNTITKRASGMNPENTDSTAAPTTPSGIAAWLRSATSEQRDALSLEQELAAFDLHEHVSAAADWRALRLMAGQLEDLLPGTPAENLPKWVIDSLIARVRKRMDVSPIGTADDWAMLSEADRYTISMLHAAVMADHEVLQRSAQEHRLMVEMQLNDADAKRLPVWAREQLLVLFDQRTRKECSSIPAADNRDEDFLDSNDGDGGTADARYDPSSDPFDTEQASQVEEPKDSALTEPTAAPAEASMPPVGESGQFRVQLRELWGYGFWGAPTVCLQNGLFPASKGGHPYYGATRESLVTVKSLSHSTIQARGERLTTRHIDVLMCVIDLEKNGNAIETTLTAILQHMMREDTTRDVREVWKMLRRLHETEVSISFKPKNTHQRREWSGTFVKHLDPDVPRVGKSQIIHIALDPGLGYLFGHRWTFVKIADRAALRRSPMASALHLAYAQHADASVAYPLETVRELLGIDTKGKYFGKLLIDALTLLESKKLIAGFDPRNGTLRVSPVMTPAKQAYFERLNREPIIVETPQEATSPLSRVSPRVRAIEQSSQSPQTVVRRDGTSPRWAKAAIRIVSSVGRLLSRFIARKPSPSVSTHRRPNC